MKRKSSQRGVPRTLVIDASVARAVSQRVDAEDASRCRAAMNAVLGYGHRIAMNEALRLEWNRHQSDFANKWRKIMVSRKRLVPVPAIVESIESRIVDLDVPVAHRKAMLKDAHLIDLARMTDQRVVSSDKTVCRLFSTATNSIAELRDIMWADPITEGEKCAAWINCGAPDESLRHLGAAVVPQ